MRKHVIEIQKSVEVVNPFGEREQTWEKAISTKADVLHKSGNRILDFHELVSAYSVEFRIRNYHNVDEKMRVLFQKKKYRILAILPDYEKRMTTISTELINE